MDGTSGLPPGFVVGEAHTPLVWPGDAGTVPIVTAERVVGSASDGTLLKVANGGDRALKFDLYISPDGERFQYTSSCTLIPKGAGYESWPYPIFAFALGNVRETKAVVCK